MKKIAVFGPGLMGASLALAVRKTWPDATVSVWARNRDRLKKAEEKGIGHEFSIRPDEAVQDADLIVLCVPISSMKPLVEDFLEAVNPKCLITDVGSVKSCVETQLAPLIGKHARWVGSHPMTGSEKSGIDAAREDLYEGAHTIITPTDETSKDTLKDIRAFWEKLGSKVFTMSPQEHDLTVASISHIPHVLAATLVQATPEGHLPVSGPGYRDTTRVAAGSPQLWVDILLENQDAVMQSMVSVIDELGTVRDLIRDQDREGLKQFLTRAAKKREGIPSSETNLDQER